MSDAMTESQIHGRIAGLALSEQRIRLLEFRIDMLIQDNLMTVSEHTDIDRDT